MPYLQTDTQRYPLEIPDIIAAHPECSFPIPFELPDGYAEVQATDRPEHNPATHRVEEIAPEQQGDQWVQRWRVVKLKAAESAELLAAQKAALTGAATAKRWEVETGGVTFPDGTRVSSTTEDQNRITTVIANAALAGVTTIDFKAASGWVSLTLAELQGVAAAIALHVQACFSAERAHHKAIEALTTLAQAQAYDIHGGWPA
ncbi:DUF4376 domain-containing protein [Acidovorax sp. FG27]|uniref:DUF4376 domain-containing protein n=1 Tax=Acidovorax sp. FG27 TaxID=3133652 RepID=UPI0030E9068C